jgi:hypothetical protein
VQTLSDERPPDGPERRLDRAAQDERPAARDDTPDAPRAERLDVVGRDDVRRARHLRGGVLGAVVGATGIAVRRAGTRSGSTRTTFRGFPTFIRFSLHASLGAPGEGPG